MAGSWLVAGDSSWGRVGAVTCWRCAQGPHRLDAVEDAAVLLTVAKIGAEA